MILKIGDRFVTKKGLSYKVVEYIGCRQVIVEFDKTKSRVIAPAREVRSGCVKDRLAPAVYGVGYIGLGAHKPSISGVATKAYTVWHGMMDRCYSKKQQERNPTYKGCNVCGEWHSFQNFAEWFELNYKDGLHIDKDINGDGKLYSPSTCNFVSRQENNACANTKNYKLINPKGELIKIYNLKKFSRDNGLDSSAMHKVFSGKIAHHKGWIR